MFCDVHFSPFPQPASLSVSHSPQVMHLHHLCDLDGVAKPDINTEQNKGAKEFDNLGQGSSNLYLRK